jgi:hypothetical protein
MCAGGTPISTAAIGANTGTEDSVNEAITEMASMVLNGARLLNLIEMVFP